MNKHIVTVFEPAAAQHSAGRIALGKQLGLQQGDALLVIDVQRDFLSGGALPVVDGDSVVPRLNAYMAAFSARDLPIFMTRDWHPRNHCSFQQQGGIWPMHCVQDTPGAEWPAELQIPSSARIISKGSEPDIEAYSGFSGTLLLERLRDLAARRVFVGGLATDYCVHDTVMDACSFGFAVVLLADAVRAVNAEPGDATRAMREMIERGVSIFEHSTRASA